MTKLEVFNSLLKEYEEDEATLDLENGCGVSGEKARARDVQDWRDKYQAAE